MEVYSLTTPSLLDMGIIRQEVAEDEELQKIISLLKQDSEGKPKFQWVQEKLLYKGRLVISKSSSLIPSILQISRFGIGGTLRVFENI